VTGSDPIDAEVQAGPIRMLSQSDKKILRYLTLVFVVGLAILFFVIFSGY